jgi:hypothetical protein
MNQSIEAAFDFVRLYRKSWFRGTLLYMLPYAMVLALSWLPKAKAHDIGSSFEMLFEALGDTNTLSFLLPGFFLSGLFTASLLRYSQNQDPTDLTWRQLAVICFPSFVRTLRAVVFLLLAVWATILIPFPLQMFLYILLVPLWFVLPAHILTGNHLLSAVRLSLVYGFRQWFPLLVIIVFMTFVCIMLGMAIPLPFSLLFTLTGLLGLVSDEMVKGYMDVVRFLDLSMAAYVLFVGASFLMLGISFLYGSAEEDNDEKMLEDEIDRFETL